MSLRAPVQLAVSEKKFESMTSERIEVISREKGATHLKVLLQASQLLLRL